jgi:hypothetical protein
VLECPPHRDAPGIGGERAVLGRVGGEFVHDKREALRGARLQVDVGPLDSDAAAEAFERLLDENLH